MKLLSFVVLVAVLACGDSSGPKGLDPIVSFENQSPYKVAMNWWSQSGLVSHTEINVGDSTCIVFLAADANDSVRYEIDDSTYRPVGTGWSKQWSPWFDPRSGIPTANPSEYPYGAEYWVIIWGGKLGPAYGADSNKYATTLPARPC